MKAVPPWAQIDTHQIDGPRYDRSAQNHHCSTIFPPPHLHARELCGAVLLSCLPAKVCATGGVGYNQDEEVHAVEMTETILQLESQNRPMRNRGNLQCLNDKGPIHAFIAVVLETLTMHSR